MSEVNLVESDVDDTKELESTIQVDQEKNPDLRNSKLIELNFYKWDKKTKVFCLIQKSLSVAKN